ncbi:MAG: hypothetical protein Ct9H300mP16_18970 [Pseudomonadota bacterium]|nr:MAG: hypothetical protein Ct9H300mP16_18970 [Pseudomonadota bacterium]
MTPEQIANAAIEAADAGAASYTSTFVILKPGSAAGMWVVQGHGREVRNSGRDVLINLTAGMGGIWLSMTTTPPLPGRALTWLTLKPDQACRAFARISRRWTGDNQFQ